MVVRAGKIVFQSLVAQENGLFLKIFFRFFEKHFTTQQRLKFSSFAASKTYVVAIMFLSIAATLSRFTTQRTRFDQHASQSKALQIPLTVIARSRPCIFDTTERKTVFLHNPKRL
jgi:hypothetical protein